MWTNLIVTWAVNCVKSNATANQATAFAIKDTKLYVPVVTSSTKENSKPLQQLKSRLKHTINWKNIIQKQTNKIFQNPYLDFLIDPSFQGVNRLFVLPLNAMIIEQDAENIIFQLQK